LYVLDPIESRATVSSTACKVVVALYPLDPLSLALKKEREGIFFTRSPPMQSDSSGFDQVLHLEGKKKKKNPGRAWSL
jgi:hypothetical protein